MWLSVLVCVGVCATVYTTPVSNTEVENIRTPREIIECCPCDGASQRRFLDTDAASGSPVSSRAGLDDCPCRARSADSEGAPSMLVPNTARPLRTFVSDEETKEDSKHILQPEVEFASSFLNTLKEATDEEYKEALARDAARSAAKDFDIETESRESDKNLVTIVVNPDQNPLIDNDVLIPEASHVQEARCAHPLERMRLRNLSSKNILNGDSNVGSSNIQKQYVDNTESKFPLSKVLKDNFMLKKPLGKSRHNSEMRQMKVNKNYYNFDTGDNGKFASNVNPIEESNEGSDNSLLGEIVTRPIKNLLKLRDIELLPKPTLTEEFSPIAEHFKNKLDLLKTVPNIKPWNLKSVLEPKSDSGVLASNIKEHIAGLKPLFPLGNLLKSKTFDEHAVQDEFEYPKTTIPKLKLFPASNLNQGERQSKPFNKQFKLTNLLEDIKSKNLKVFKSSEVDIHDNGASASSVDEQIVPITNFEQSQDELTSNQKLAVPLKPNLLPTLNLSRLDDVLKPLTTLSLPNIFHDASKPVEKIDHGTEDKKPELNLSSNKDDLHTEILDTMPSESEMSIASENNDNGEQSNEQTICEASIENTVMDQSTDSSIQITSIVDENESSEQVLNNEGLENSDDGNTSNFESQRSSEDTDCNLEDDTSDQSAVITQMLPHDEDDLSCEQSIDQSAVTRQILAPTEEGFTTDQTEGASDIIPQTLTPNNDLPSTNSQLEESTISDSDDGSTTQKTDINRNYKTVTYQELQRMSDSLLDKNNKQSNEKIVNTEETTETKNTYDPITTENIFNSGSDDNHVSRKGNILGQDTELKKSSLLASEKGVKSGCLTSKVKVDNGNKRDGQSNEMAVEASEKLEIAHSFLNNIPIQANKIVQPKNTLLLPSLIKKDADGISSITTNIPSINDLQLHIRNMINGEAPKLPSISGTNSADVDLISAMSKPQKSKLLPSKHLEDIKYDIFQVKPLDLSHALKNPLNIPELNLNPTRAKSTLSESLFAGNKKGVLGSSLDFVPDIFKETKNHVVEQNILGSTLNLPDLKNLKAKMKDRFLNLLPIESPASSVLQDTAGSNPIEILNDRFRSHTDEAVQSIQNTLGSVFEETKESPNILGSSFTHPKDFIADITQRHEDLKDKLEGIRYDLNDRLASFHEEILEKSKFVLPPFPHENIMSFKPKITQPTIKSTVQNRNSQKRKPVKTKMVSAASNTVPKVISAPRLRTPSNLQPLNSNTMERLASQQIEAAMPSTTKQYNPLTPTQSTLKRLHNLSASNLRIPEKAKNSQIKIAFPSKTSKNQIEEKEMMKPKTNAYTESKQKPIEKLFKSQYNSKDLKKNSDSNSFPSDIKKSKNPTLSTPANTIFKTNRKSLLPKERSTFHDRSLLSNPLKTNKQVSGMDLKKEYTIPKTSWPKTSNSSDFLSKVREALKARLLKNEKGKVSIVKETAPTEVMTRAASEISKVGHSVKTNESIKENTPYKCRLLCTKDSSEV